MYLNASSLSGIFLLKSETIGLPRFHLYVVCVRVSNVCCMMLCARVGMWEGVGGALVFNGFSFRAFRLFDRLLAGDASVLLVFFCDIRRYNLLYPSNTYALNQVIV